MGVATANSILVVSFAREQLEILVGDARKAALNAGFVRLRPVLMTALAMIIGMVPMALGLGEGGEQNAPLGRAVIGGLLLATLPPCSLSLRSSPWCTAGSNAAKRLTAHRTLQASMNSISFGVAIMTNESKPNPQSPGAHDHESAPDQPSVSPRKAMFGIVVVLIIFAALAVFGMLSRRHND